MLLFHSSYILVYQSMTLYLLKAALRLHSSCQLLLLLHSHPDDLLQEFFSGLLGVRASIQHLSQGVNLWANRAWQPGGSLLSSGSNLRGQSLRHVGGGWWRGSQGGGWHWTWGWERLSVITTIYAFTCLKCFFVILLYKTFKQLFVPTKIEFISFIFSKPQSLHSFHIQLFSPNKYMNSKICRHLIAFMYYFSETPGGDVLPNSPWSSFPMRPIR